MGEGETKNADRLALPIGTSGASRSDDAASLAPTLLSPALPEGPARDSSPAGPSPGSFADYEILGEIARGGMGIVYRARHKKLNRVVALKVILAGSHAGREERERFRVEAESIARLQHPNIVQIYEVGETDGLPFLSLEFCSGGSLSRQLDGTPLRSREAAELVQVLARAVHAAHQAQVVHRDLKPGNVLFSSDGAPKISDFGLAKKLDDHGQTQTGAIVGTPSYMAPEQAAGSHAKVGPAADIYALGALLYECLTGRPPFKSATPLETVRQVLHEEPLPPLRLQPRTPRDIDTICLKCLHKDPARRYATAADLADDLRRYLNDEPVRARPVGAIERAWRWCRRNPSRAAAAILGLLLVAGAIVVPVVLAVRESLNAAKIAYEQIKTSAALDESRQATQRALDAEREKTEKLWQSHLERARAGLASRIVGQRFESLKALREAAAIRPDRQLRNEAIACLALVDLRLAGADAVFVPGDPQLSAGPGKTQATDPASGRTARQEGKLVIVDGPQGEKLLELPHPRSPDFLSWSPDGRILAVACNDRAVYLWKIPEGRLQATLEGLNSGLTFMDFHPAGTMLLTGGFDGSTRLWDPASGQVLVRSLTSYIVGPFSRDGRLLKNNFNLLEVADGRECRVLYHGEAGNRAQSPGALPGPWEVEFTGDGKLVAAWGADGPRLWDVATGRELAFFNHHGTVEGGGCIAGGKHLCFSGTSGVFAREIAADPDDAGSRLIAPRKRLWPEFGPGFVPANITAPVVVNPAVARRMRASADGRRVAIAQPDANRAVVVETDDPRQVRYLEGQPACQYVAISPDGRWVASGSWAWSPPSPVKIWDMESGMLAHEITEHSFGTLNFTPDGRWLVIGSQVQYGFWEVGKWSSGLVIPRNSNLPAPAAFSADGRLMALCPSNFAVRLVNPQDGNEIAMLIPPEPKLVSDLRFSPDGEKLAVATENNLVYLWDLRMIRDELRTMNLDWAPPLAARPSALDLQPLRVHGPELLTPGQ